ncbi:MAG: ATP-binding protein, partial [Alphaproteobacteria bacterium]|nr:ATP-binding protein [Alphaproteobacteria bacterium]
MPINNRNKTAGYSGKGIAPADLDKIFEPFFTTKEVGEGSGLGLSMVYGFAKQSGGTVTIFSEPGEGTSVKLYLPALAESEDDAVPDREMPGIPVARGETILVIEDDLEVRELAVALLSDFGYTTVEAETAGAALDVLERNPGIDLMLSDVVLPGAMNGPDLAVEVRRRSPAI